MNSITMNLSERSVDKELLFGELCSKENTLFSGVNAKENTLFSGVNAKENTQHHTDNHVDHINFWETEDGVFWKAFFIGLNFANECTVETITQQTNIDGYYDSLSNIEKMLSQLFSVFTYGDFYKYQAYIESGILSGISEIHKFRKFNDNYIYGFNIGIISEIHKNFSEYVGYDSPYILKHLLILPFVYDSKYDGYIKHLSDIITEYSRK